jgi:hypothetical protein
MKHRLTRLPPSAARAEQRIYFSALAAALDAAGIEPGDDFYVVPAAEHEAVQGSGFHDEMPLGEARTCLRGLVEEGHTCPLCQQLAKVYRRTLNAGMARALVVFYRQAGTDWAHKPTLLDGLGAAARDESLLRFWGLFEEESAVREDGGRASVWRVTPQGEAWVKCETTVPKYVRVYAGRCLGLEGDPITVRDALGNRFDYGELMRGV